MSAPVLAFTHPDRKAPKVKPLDLRLADVRLQWLYEYRPGAFDTLLQAIDVFIAGSTDLPWIADRAIRELQTSEGRERRRR